MKERRKTRSRSSRAQQWMTTSRLFLTSHFRHVNGESSVVCRWIGLFARSALSAHALSSPEHSNERPMLSLHTRAQYWIPENIGRTQRASREMQQNPSTQVSCYDLFDKVRDFLIAMYFFIVSYFFFSYLFCFILFLLICYTCHEINGFQ